VNQRIAWPWAWMHDTKQQNQELRKDSGSLRAIHIFINLSEPKDPASAMIDATIL
jgi:hypothetical protein